MYKLSVILLTVLGINGAVLAATGKQVPAQEAIKQLKYLFNGDNTIEGEGCEMFLVKTNDGGIILGIKDNLGKTASISAYQNSTFIKYSSEYEFSYEIIDNITKLRSKVEVQYKEDISDFHLILTPYPRAASVSCSYYE